ncbi:DUF5667 domain-containing protein [Micromonospora polyrhachis]|uniref:DUF5667 domain-containing protein n=1 Tax=Micromonospora polyrhachis TaxID=1282883 RepID=A0A7W7SRP0_9ACTN|nr:hypothetical protein [Micromonospora polyrhachis]
MTTTVFYRRRAERFAQLLDEANGGRRHHVRSHFDQELAGLVSLSDQISAAQPPAEVHPDFRTGLRAMLIATAERDGIGVTASTEPVAAPPKPSPPVRQPAQELLRPTLGNRQSRARGAFTIGAAVGAIALSGMAAASAVPGDALYAVKRSTERAQLALTNSDLSRGQLFLDFARTRLTEAEAVRGKPDDFTAALDDMDAHTRQGVKLLTTSALQHRDEAALDAIGSFLTGQRGQVSRLLDESTSATERHRTGASLALLESIGKRTDNLRTALRCASVAAMRSDDLGPVPAGCPAGRGLQNGQPAGAGEGSRPTGRTPHTPQPGSQVTGEPAGSRRLPGITPSTPVDTDPGKLTEPIISRPAD